MAAMNVTVTITKLVLETDMRKIHVYRRHKRGLRNGQGVLLMNVARTMVRIITASGGFYQDYAPKDEIFDVPTIQKQIASLRLYVKFTPTDEAKVNDYEETDARRVA